MIGVSKSPESIANARSDDIETTQSHWRCGVVPATRPVVRSYKWTVGLTKINPEFALLAGAFRPYPGCTPSW